MGNEVGALYISIGAKMDEALAAIAKIQTELKGVESSTKSAEDKFKKFADTCKNVGQQFKDFGKPLALAGAAITGAFAIAIKKTADLGDEFKDLAQRTGIAVETLSSFKLAADKSGTSVQGFATGMKGLSRVMYEAASGGKEAQEAFKAVGVSATDSSGKLRPLDQVMLDVADRFAGMADGAEKNALAMKLFGKAGMDLIPMLNLGRQGLQENIDKMQKYGVVTREEAEAGDAFNDAMTDLQAATGGLSRAIAGTLIPALTKFAEGAADIVAKVGAWAREHKGLTTVLAGGTFAIGAVATALGTLAYGIGTVISQLPKLITGLKAISAFAAKSIVFMFTLAGVAIVAAGVAKMIADFKKLREEGKTTADALAAMAPSFNPFKSMSREGLGKFLTDMDAARDKSINLKGAMILLGEAFRAIRGAVEQGAITPVANLTAIFKDFGLKTRTELTAELAKAEEALKLLKASAEATPGAIKALEDKIKTLKEGITGVTVETRSLAEQLGITFRSDIETQIKKLNEALLTYRGKMTAEEVQRIYTEINTLTASMEALKGPVIDLGKAFDILMSSMDNLPATAGEIAAAINAEFKDLAEEMQADFEKLAMKDLPAYLQNIPAASKEAADETKSVWQECSTVIADSMRDIAKAIIGLFNFKGLFGAVAIDVKFDSSGFDAMVKAAESAYDKVTDAARKSFDAQELLTSRAEEDFDRDLERHYDSQDRAYERQYENNKRAIENSKMTEAEKYVALRNLEIAYEDAKAAREIARENKRVALERKREDAKYKRELAQGAKLLALQVAHEAAVAAIQAAADAARQKQADDELKRQNSLWFKVKGIFATAIESMATIFLTRLFQSIGDLIADLASKIFPKIGKSLDDTGGKVKGLGTTIGEFISGIGTGIGGFISGLATGIATAITAIAAAIGTVIVTLATAIASAATILAAAAPAFIVIGLIALGIYATIAALKRLFSSQGTGAGDGMGRVVERQDQQTSLLTQIKDLTIDNRAILDAIKKALWIISTATQQSRGYLNSCALRLQTIASKGYLATVVSYLKKIADTIGNLTGTATATTTATVTGAGSGSGSSHFASGGIAWTPQLARVAERGPEMIMPLRDYRADMTPRASASGRERSINLTFNVNAIDRAGVETFLRRDARPILQRMFDHNDFNVPVGAVGGP